MNTGFAIHHGVIAPEEVSALAASLVGVVRLARAGARHLMSHDPVRVLASDTRLLDLARAELGSEAVPYRATLFDKSPRANWLVTWHQDTALPLRARVEAAGWGPWSHKAGVLYAHAPASALEQVVALRVHLDESGPDNGPLRVLPDTHTLGVLTDQAVHELAQRIESHTCCIESGGVIAMRPLLVHASSKATRERPRRVLHIEYAASLVLGSGHELAVA
jgi:ectoine hydroxylase-related dioxygenase (phytanoyl-CoA dioxygenase family)